MFGSIGMTEVIIIAGVALVVMGPERFPEFAKIVMRTFRELRGYWEDTKRDIQKELRPVKDEVRKLQQYDPEDYLDALTSGDDEEDAEDEEDGDEEDEEEGPEASSETEDPYRDANTPRSGSTDSGTTEARAPSPPETATKPQNTDDFDASEWETPYDGVKQRETPTPVSEERAAASEAPGETDDGADTHDAPQSPQRLDG